MMRPEKEAAPDDTKTMGMLLELVRDASAEDRNSGGSYLSEDDRNFIHNKRSTIGSYGLTGGIVSGGAGLLASRYLKPWARIPVVMAGWLVGSGVGRYVAVERSVLEMYQLPEPSMLGRKSREIIRNNAPKNGYFSIRMGKLFPNNVTDQNDFTDSSFNFDKQELSEQPPTFDIESYFNGNVDDKTKASESQSLESNRKTDDFASHNSPESNREIDIFASHNSIFGELPSSEIHPAVRDMDEEYDNWGDFKQPSQESSDHHSGSKTSGYKTWDQVRDEYKREASN